MTGDHYNMMASWIGLSSEYEYDSAASFLKAFLKAYYYIYTYIYYLSYAKTTKKLVNTVFCKWSDGATKECVSTVF